MTPQFLCVGEVLWDALPGGLFLGGAPFNVACQLHEIGERVTFASRLGDDELGREITRRLIRRGISTDLVQIDKKLPTGFVIVELGLDGVPTYEIVEPSSWDSITADEALVKCAEAAQAVVFGSLAQRSETSRHTIELLTASNPNCVFDVNLRPPFDIREVVEFSLKSAKIVKLNDEELSRLIDWFDLPEPLQDGAESLAERFECETVCVTQGENGAALLHGDMWVEHPGFVVDVADTVGSGDAFLAALLSGLLADHDPEQVLISANAMGAFVATQHGATPAHDPEAIDQLRGSRQ